MFWDIFYNLCIERGSKPNPVAKELEISSGTVTKWKAGSLPSCEALIKLANYFDVTVDFLLGLETENKKIVSGEPTRNDLISRFSDLSENELTEIENYLDFLQYKRTH